MPVKLRFGNGSDRLFEFEENLNIGLHFGYKWQLRGKNKQALHGLLGIGVSKVAFTETNYDNYNSENNSGAAFSLSIGGIYQYELFQIGLFFGTDYVSGTNVKNWKYQGKPWLGLGLGVSLFSKDQKDGENGSNK